MHAAHCTLQEGLCSKELAPSVSSISRVLRGAGHTTEGELPEQGELGERPSHSIEGILGGEEELQEEEKKD